MVRDPAQPLTRNPIKARAFFPALIAASLCVSCAPPGDITLGPSSAQLTAPGDWDDLDAAIDATLSRHLIAIESQDAPDANTRRFMLRTNLDEPGLLELRRTNDGSIDMTCSIGRFGRPTLEAKVIDSLNTRLEQLKGPNVATPIRWPD